MVFAKFPYRKSVENDVAEKAEAGAIGDAGETTKEANHIIDRAKEELWRHTDRSGGVRARRDEAGAVVGDVPMGTFVFQDKADAKTAWEILANSQRALARLGVGGSTWTTPMHYEPIGKSGSRVRILDEETSQKVGRKVGQWSTRQGFISIDIPTNAKRRHEFYEWYNNYSETMGYIERVGPSGYVGKRQHLERLYRAAEDVSAGVRA